MHTKLYMFSRTHTDKRSCLHTLGLPMGGRDRSGTRTEANDESMTWVEWMFLYLRSKLVLLLLLIIIKSFELMKWGVLGICSCLRNGLGLHGPLLTTGKKANATTGFLRNSTEVQSTTALWAATFQSTSPAPQLSGWLALPSECLDYLCICLAVNLSFKALMQSLRTEWMETSLSTSVTCVCEFLYIDQNWV